MKFESDGNILPMAHFKTKSRFTGLAEMEAYWQALRAGRLVPLRSEIDPRGIEQTLDFAFVIERIAPGLARFRLAGSHLSELMGMDVRGMPITSLFTPSSRTILGENLEAVFDGPEILETALQSEKSIGRPTLDAQLLVLPLKSDLGDITRAIGCLSTRGRVGRSPRRFDLIGAPMRRALGFDPKPAAVNAPSIEFAETVSAFEHEKAAHPSERPYLRLLSSED